MPAAIVGFIAAAGVPGLVTAAGALTGLGTIISAGIGLGLSVGASLLLGGSKSASPKPSEVRTVLKNSVAARTRHYGRVRLGGSLAFVETENGNLHKVVCFAGQDQLDGIEAYYIDDGVFTLGPKAGYPGTTGWAQEAPHSGRSVYVETRLGTPDQTAFQILRDRFAPIWTAAHQLKGVACAHLMASSVKQEDFSNVYPKGVDIELNVLARGVRVYDPRSGSVAWSTNLALHLLDYLTHASGARIPLALIDLPRFAAAANVCDGLVPVKGGGNLQRYQGSLSYSFEADPVSVIERVIRATDGWLTLTGEGKVAFDAGIWSEPTVTITDDAIISYEVTPGSGPFASANEVIVKYTHTGAGYTEATAEPWRDEDLIATMGVLSSTVDCYEILQHNHARRIAKLIQRRACPRWRVTVVTDLRGMEAWDQRWVRVQIPDEGIDETFEMAEAPELDSTSMTVKLTLISFGAEAYSFDPETEEGTAPSTPVEVMPEAIPVPSGLSVGYTTVDSRTLDGGSGSPTPTGSTTLYVLTIGWAAPPRPDLRVEVEYAVASSEDWQAVSVSPGTTSVRTGSVGRGTSYKVRARHRGTNGGTSAWTSGGSVAIP